MAGELVVSGTPSSEDVIAYFANPGAIEFRFEEDPEEVAGRILAQQLGSESPEALFGSEEVLHAQDLIGVPLEFLSVEWRPSSLVDGEGLPFFGVFRVVDAAGEVRTMTCGATTVCLKVAVAHARGWLPRWLKIVVSDEPTKSGRRPMDIVDAKAPVGEGKDRF